MRDICTKTGDNGTTGLRGGVRVDKDDIRIETNGQIDQLNALLGMVRARLQSDGRDSGMVYAIQKELMAVMSHVATPSGMDNPRALHVVEMTAAMEREVATSQHAQGFVVPGDNELSALIHLARTQARTVERRLWSLNREYELDKNILVWANRLSDYLFVLANKVSV